MKKVIQNIPLDAPPPSSFSHARRYYWNEYGNCIKFFSSHLLTSGATTEKKKKSTYLLNIYLWHGHDAGEVDTVQADNQLLAEADTVQEEDTLPSVADQGYESQLLVAHT